MRREGREPNARLDLEVTNSQSLLKLMSIESVIPSSHLILCHPLLLLPPIPPSIRVFSNESTLRMTWPKYWSFIPRGVRPRLEGKPRTPLSSRVATRVSWLLEYGASGGPEGICIHSPVPTPVPWGPLLGQGFLRQFPAEQPRA